MFSSPIHPKIVGDGSHTLYKPLGRYPCSVYFFNTGKKGVNVEIFSLVTTDSEWGDIT